MIGALPLMQEPSRGGRLRLGGAGRGGGGRYTTWLQGAQVGDAQGLRAHQPRCVAVGARHDQQRPEVAPAYQYLAELGRAAATRRAARHAAVSEDGALTPDRVGQDNQGQELPAGTDLPFLLPNSVETATRPHFRRSSSSTSSCRDIHCADTGDDRDD